MDRLNQRVEEFDDAAPPNNLMGTEGKRGTAVGDYSWPETVAVAPNGNVWVGDTRNNRLEEYSPNLALPPLAVVTGTTVGVFNYIEGITVDANGTVWIADTDNNRIVSYNPTTKAMTAYGTRGKGTVGSPVQFIDPKASPCPRRTSTSPTPGTTRIDEVSLTGTLLATYSTGISAPQGVTLGTDGTVWVADTGTNSTDPSGNQIVHLSATLTNLNDGFGGPGHREHALRPAALAGTFRLTGSILFVADTYNNRVQEYNITGS